MQSLNLQVFVFATHGEPEKVLSCTGHGARGNTTGSPKSEPD